MEIALIVLICICIIDLLPLTLVMAVLAAEMLWAALLFCLKWFGYLLLFGLCIQIVGWLCVLLYRLYKRFKRWRHSRRAMREICCELEEEENDSESSRLWEWWFWG